MPYFHFSNNYSLKQKRIKFFLIYYILIIFVYFNIKKIIINYLYSKFNQMIIFLKYRYFLNFLRVNKKKNFLKKKLSLKKNIRRNI